MTTYKCVWRYTGGWLTNTIEANNLQEATEKAIERDDLHYKDSPLSRHRLISIEEVDHAELEETRVLRRIEQAVKEVKQTFTTKISNALRALQEDS